MRLRYPNNESVIDNSGAVGIELTFVGPLKLNGDPIENKDTSNKGYVDRRFISLDASKITQSTLFIERVPKFTGDATNTQGTNIFTLVSSGINPGSHVKVTVDAKGRVVSSSGINLSDIPNFSWEKITRNKPTTLEGYGVTDGIKTSGDLAPNGIISDVEPNKDLHAATKSYIDNLPHDINDINIGTVIVVSSDITPVNFLRANGGLVSKTTYANLYAVIGDTFTGGSQRLGSGKPWKQQYEINTEQSADITGWATGTSSPGPLTYSQAIVTKNRVYLLAFYFGSYTSAVYTAPINADGTLGAWTASTSSLEGLTKTQAIVTKGRVYLLGGVDIAGYASTVYTAPIKADGTLGTWTTGTPLPVALVYSQAIVTKDRVYLLGGLDSGINPTSTVYTAPINTDGTLGTWTTGTPLPGALYGSQAIVTKDRVYLLGGRNTSAVYTAPINADGTLGTWATGTSLPGVLGHSQAIVTKGRVYLLGGVGSGGAYASTVYTAPINADGTLGTWTTGTPLPEALAYSQAIVTKDRVYLLGGHNDMSTVYTAPILGGLNDYSPYYDGTITPLDSSSTTFRLPDYSHNESSAEKFYIRY